MFLYNSATKRRQDLRVVSQHSVPPFVTRWHDCSYQKPLVPGTSFKELKGPLDHWVSAFPLWCEDLWRLRKSGLCMDARKLLHVIPQAADYTTMQTTMACNVRDRGLHNSSQRWRDSTILLLLVIYNFANSHWRHEPRNARPKWKQNDFKSFCRCWHRLA